MSTLHSLVTIPDTEVHLMPSSNVNQEFKIVNSWYKNVSLSNAPDYCGSGGASHFFRFMREELIPYNNLDEDETHTSVAPATISRGLRTVFA